MKKIALILSGCGVYDGSEIHEATLTMLAIAKNDAQYACFAPDINQHHVINHTNGEEMNENRNVLIESARIARGNISPLSQLVTKDFDAIVFPGGFGAAKNLSNLAFKGAECSVNKEIESIIQSFHQAKKPIAALCIAPAIITQVITGASVTIGNDQDTINTIESMNGNHQITTHGEVVYDKKNKIFTTPCYMLDATIVQIEKGVNNLINELLKHC